MISLLYINSWKSAAIDDSGAEPALPSPNVLTEQPTTICRFTGAGPHYIDFDCGSPVTVRQLFPGYHNAAVGDTFQLVGATAPAGLGSPDFTGPIRDLIPGSPSGFNRHSTLLHLSISRTYRAWRVWFNVSVDPFDIGIVSAGDPIELPAGFGLGDGMVDPSETSRSLGGNAYVEPRGGWRELAFPTAYLPEAEARALAPIDRLNGTRIPMVVCDRPEQDAYKMDNLFWAKLTGAESFVTQQGHSDPIGRRYRRRYQFEEMELP